MKALKFIFILMITFYVGFSCDSSTYYQISGEVANPTYTSNVKPVIENNCLSCHSAAGAQYPIMETYVQLRDATEIGAVICRIDDQSCGAVMPQSGRMPQTSINTIKKWAANGYPN
jgi:uncharacterized membrane protein